jgi:hypothetical protein
VSISDAAVAAASQARVTGTMREALEAAWDHTQEEMSEAGRLLLDEQCCEFGCNGGACESCVCCSAGWCVSGHDFLNGGDWPEGEDLENWLAVAAEKSPVAAALKAALDKLELLQFQLADAEQ